MTKATISKLRIYPIKSLGFIELNEAEIGVHSLKNDRLFAMKDEEGKYVNGKRTNLVNLLNTEYDLVNGLVKFTEKSSGNQYSFELKEGNDKLDDYLSSFFGAKLKLVKNKEGVFMDIPKNASVSIVSEATLQYLQNEMDQHTLESMRNRFRTNIEVSGVKPFWEEQLYQKPGIGVRFRLGEVEMHGIAPRQRCNVPPQNPETGEIDNHFVKTIIKSRMDHKETVEKILQYGRAPYYLTIDAYVPKSEIGKKIKLNDTIEILEPIQLED